jgi:transposase
MDYFAGLDVSVKDTSVCIVAETGKIIREVKVASEPDALLAVLRNAGYHFKRIGLEAGPLSQWLFSALAEADLPVICVETRHMRAVLKAQINKTDRNDVAGRTRTSNQTVIAETRVNQGSPHSGGVVAVAPDARSSCALTADSDHSGLSGNRAGLLNAQSWRLIIVWLEVRVRPAPPHSPSRTEIFL